MANTNLSPPGGSSSQDTGSVTILIADDDEFFRMALSTIIKKTFTEATVIETSSLDEALERWRTLYRTALAEYHTQNKLAVAPHAPRLEKEAASRRAWEAKNQLALLRKDVEMSIQQSVSRRLTAAQDVTWALINSPAFLFNH